MHEIEKIDYDRYLMMVFAEQDNKEDIETLIKFNIELSRIKNKVTDENIGKIRLAWWSEFIDDIYSSKNPKNHELTEGLTKLIKGNAEVEKEDLLTLIRSRELDFDQVPFLTEDDLINYLKNTSGQFNILISKLILGKDYECNLDPILNNLGVVWGLSVIVRPANGNLAKGRDVFPASLSELHNLKRDYYGSFDYVKLSQPVVKHLIELSNNLISNITNQVNDLDKPLKKKLKPLLINLFLSNRHNLNIKSNDYNVFSKGYNIRLGLIDLFKLYFL